MGWGNISIKLEPAKALYPDCDIQPEYIDDKISSYSANHNGTPVQSTTLFKLCQKLRALDRVMTPEKQVA